MKTACMDTVRIIVWISYILLPIYLIFAHLQIDYGYWDDVGVAFLSDFLKFTYVPLVYTFLIIITIFTLFIFLGFMKRRKPEQVAREYDLIKLLMYYYIGVVIICITALSLDDILNFDEPVKSFLGKSLGVSYVGMVSLLICVRTLKRKESALIICKGYFLISLNSISNQNLVYLQRGLLGYNSFLFRNIDMKINDLNKILSSLTISDLRERKRLLTEVIDSLGDTEFKTVRVLSTFAKEEPENFLGRKTENEIILEAIKIFIIPVLSFIAAIISVILSIR